MIFRKGSRVIHFVHIPKTGGTSIRKLITRNGWTIDRKTYYTKEDGYEKSHPHHTSKVYRSRKSTLESEFSFCVVRNPVDRAVSEIFYTIKEFEKSKENVNKTSRDSITPQGIMHYMHGVFSELMPAKGLGVDDNHWVPQHYFVDEKVRVFNFENLQEVVEFLIAKDVLKEGTEIIHENKSRDSSEALPDWSYAPDVSKFFYNLYKKDFEKFGYDPPDEILNLLK